MSTKELPGMPEGTVPKSVRGAAELYVERLRRVVAEKGHLETAEEKLMTEMGREKVNVAVVVLDGLRYVIRLDPGKIKIKTKVSELAPE